MTKKFTFLTLITIFALLVIFLGVSFASFPAYAEETDDSPEVSDGETLPDDENINPQGYKLDEGYAVKITYRAYTQRISGIYRAIEVTLDEKFRFGEGGEEKTNLLFNQLSALFDSSGYTVAVDKNGRFVAGMSFDTMTDYYIANGIDGYEKNESSGEQHTSFFYVDYKSESPSVFAIIEDEGNYFNYILQFCYGLGITREEVCLEYVYGTPYKIIETNADTVAYSVSNGIYLHKYEMNMDSKDRTVVISQHSPNSVGWYSLAVMIAISILAIPLTVYILKLKKKKEV